MLHFLLTALWDSALVQFGIAGLVLAGAVATFIYVPLPAVRHIAVATASVCVVFLFLGPKLYIEGVSHEKAKWDAAITADVQRGVDARAKAERDVPPVSVAPTPDATLGSTGGFRRINPFARRVPDDRYDRDRAAGPVQRVAPNHLQPSQRHAAHHPANPRPQPNGAAVGVLGVVEPSGTYPCWQVRLGLATLTQKKLDELARKATPEQRAAAQKCLEKRGR